MIIFLCEYFLDVMTGLWTLQTNNIHLRTEQKTHLVMFYMQTTTIKLHVLLMRF